MSERLLGPDLNSRLAYIPSGSVLLSAAGGSAVMYASASGSTLADVLTYNGTSTPGIPIANSTLIVDSDSLIPLFWFPVDTDTVYVEINGGTRTAINADYDARIDNVSGFVNSPVMSTGIIAGGRLTPNATNVKAVDISPYIAYIVDYETDNFNPTMTKLSSSVTQTVALDAAAQTRILTWWSIKSDNTFHQSADRPSNRERRERVQIGVTLYDPVIGNIFIANTVNVEVYQIVNQLYDLMYALGGFSVTGNVISAAGSTLSLTKTAGSIFSPSVAHNTLEVDPHVQILPFTSPMTFRHATRVIDSYTTARTTLDVGNYDLNGVVTPVGGGTNSSTIFRVWYVPLTDASFQYIIQYGQTVYSSLANATAAIGKTAYVPNNAFVGSAVLLGHVAVIRTATNLSDPTQASVITSSVKFQRP